MLQWDKCTLVSLCSEQGLMQNLAHMFNVVCEWQDGNMKGKVANYPEKNKCRTYTGSQKIRLMVETRFGILKSSLLLSRLSGNPLKKHHRESPAVAAVGFVKLTVREGPLQVWPSMHCIAV